MTGPTRALPLLFFALLLPLAAQPSTLDRDRDPVVLTGLELPSLSGAAVDRIAAFRYQGEWIQIPVQVYVYLFETTGTPDPGAGASYGAYSFDLLVGSYIPDYDTAGGPNPEDSEFVSPLYRTHFSDRWIRDRLEVTTAGSSGGDILDRRKNPFGPGVCTRNEETFSDGEGAFFANISGPVRSIRSYMGANSGPLTQREHVFYAGDRTSPPSCASTPSPASWTSTTTAPKRRA